jgi:hypothetical protein
LNQEGRYADAEALARKTLESQRRILGPQHDDTLETLKQLGKSLAFTDRYAVASRLYRDLIERENTLGW